MWKREVCCLKYDQQECERAGVLSAKFNINKKEKKRAGKRKMATPEESDWFDKVAPSEVDASSTVQFQITFPFLW